MMAFNDLLQHLDLVDIPFQGRNYTWSNMQDDPLLEKLDWVFTSPSRTLSYPSTVVQGLGVQSHMTSLVPFCYQNWHYDPKGFNFSLCELLGSLPSFQSVVDLH